MATVSHILSFTKPSNVNMKMGRFLQLSAAWNGLSRIWIIAHCEEDCSPFQRGEQHTMYTLNLVSL